MIERIANWYKGKFVAYHSEPGSSLVFMGGSYERHWTARAARAVAEFYLREWKWIIGTVIAVVAVIFKIVN